MGYKFPLVLFVSAIVGVPFGHAQPVPPVPPKLVPPTKNVLIEDAPTPSSSSTNANNLGSLKAATVPEKRVTNSFQRFIGEHSGVTLPMFGHELFLAPPSTFAPADDIPVTPDYVIGPGDELIIRGWGQIDINLRVVVDRNGAINIPKVGDIHVVGLRSRELQGFLKGQVGKLFQNFEMNVTMGRLRSIQVLVVGHAYKPGNYTISSLSTLVNAIFASGGPSASGTLRKIQLKRDNKLVTELDLYDLLLKGDKDQDAKLQSGDVIFFPPMGKLVAVTGQVNNPAVFELKGESTVSEVLEWTGGIAANARGSSIEVERMVDRQYRKALVLDVKGAAVKELVQEGDLITVSSISPRFKDTVLIRGHVAVPSRVPWTNGMKVSDLFRSRDSLIPFDYWVKQNALTKPVRAEDLKNDLTKPVRAEDLKNDLKFPQAPVNWEYAAIQRMNPDDLSSSLISFNLRKAVFDKLLEHDHPLHQGDIVTIFSQSDIRIPLDKRAQFVTLEGEFMQPGVYQLRPKETLRDLVERLGGFSTNAYLYAAVFTRENVRVEQQARMDEALSRLELQMQRSAVKSQSETISAEAVFEQKLELDSRRLLIEKMRSIRAVGRVAVDLKQESNSKLPAITLEDGDRLYVPSAHSEIHIIGSVVNHNSHFWRPNNKVIDYIELAGGWGRDSDKSYTYIIRANGSVYGKGGGWFSSSISSTRLQPGDTIVVPEMIGQISWRRELRDWAQIASQFAIAAAAIKVFSP